MIKITYFINLESKLIMRSFTIQPDKKTALLVRKTRVLFHQLICSLAKGIFRRDETQFSIYGEAHYEKPKKAARKRIK